MRRYGASFLRKNVDHLSTKVVKLIFKFVVLLSLLVLCVKCSSDKYAGKMGRDWYTDYPDEVAGRYFIKYAPVWNGIELKLYNADSRELLARRKYNSNGFIKFTWSEDSLIYDTAKDSFFDHGIIYFPPSTWDWLWARLPW